MGRTSSARALASISVVFEVAMAVANTRAEESTEMCVLTRVAEWSSAKLWLPSPGKFGTGHDFRCLVGPGLDAIAPKGQRTVGRCPVPHESTT